MSAALWLAIPLAVGKPAKYILQLQLDYIKSGENRDKGIEQAVTHANQVNEGWSEKAYRIFKEWLSGWPKGFQFLIEDFRVSANARGLETPPSLRAYGFITPKARKEGLIIQVGTDKTKNPDAHRANVGKWQKV